MILRFLIPTVLLTAFIAPVGEVCAEEGPAAPRRPKLEFVYFSVKQATTPAIATAARQRVEAVRGVQSFAWTVERAEAKIVRIVGQADNPTLLAAFGQGGVRAAVLPIAQSKLVFQSRLHCNSCVIKVKRALKPLKGTKEVQVSKDRQSVTVIYDTSKTTLQQIKRALAAADYAVR